MSAVIDDTPQTQEVRVGGDPSTPEASGPGRAASAAGEYLSFRLGDEEYGVEILKVREIRSYTQPTRMANAPDRILGVINLRGVIVPIVDLRIQLGLGEVRYDESTVVIVLGVAGRVVGVVVDSVSDVRRLEAAQIRPAPEFSEAVDSRFIVGIGAISHDKHLVDLESSAERLLILVNIEALLGMSDLGADATA